MNPGRLRESITVQKRSETVPSTGRSPERSESPWVDEFSDRADVTVKSPRTGIDASQETPERKATFLVRTRSEYRAADITEKRIEWEGEAWEVIGVQPVDQQRRHLEITALYSGNSA